MYRVNVTKFTAKLIQLKKSQNKILVGRCLETMSNAIFLADHDPENCFRPNPVLNVQTHA